MLPVPRPVWRALAMTSAPVVSPVTTSTTSPAPSPVPTLSSPTTAAGLVTAAHPPAALALFLLLNVCPARRLPTFTPTTPVVSAAVPQASSSTHSPRHAKTVLHPASSAQPRSAYVAEWTPTIPSTISTMATARQSVTRVSTLRVLTLST